MGSSGGGSSKVKTQQTASVPEEFQGIFGQFNKTARNASDRLQSLGPFRGDFIASPNQTQLNALGGLEGLAGSRTDLGGPSLDLLNRTIGGEFLLPESNPFLQSTIDAATRPVFENFEERLLPQLRSNAIAQGAEGGTRNALVESQAARDTSRVAGDIASKIAFENLARERGLQHQAVALGPQANALSEANLRLLGEVGDTERGFSQEELNNRILQFNEKVAAIQRPLDPLATFFGSTGLPFSQSSVSKSSSGGGGSSAGGIIQGAAGGAAAGSVLGPWGALAGGVIGGVVSLF